jgi:hypothetical protein
MKETILGAGMILLFAGIIVLPMSLQSTRNEEPQVLAEREFLVFPDWTVSAEFNKSEELITYFSRPNTEGVPDGDEAIAYMFVDIVDPNGGNTTFNVSFSRTSFEVRLDENDGGLLVNLPSAPGPADIGGTTQYSGVYTARVYTYLGLVAFYYTNSSTMRRLEIDKVTVETDYPNVWALPVAVSLVAVGVIGVVWGAGSQKRRARPRKLRKE